MHVVVTNIDVNLNLNIDENHVDFFQFSIEIMISNTFIIKSTYNNIDRLNQGSHFFDSTMLSIP